MSTIEIVTPIIAAICMCIVFVVKKYRSNCSFTRENGFKFDFRSSTQRDTSDT